MSVKPLEINYANGLFKNKTDKPDFKGFANEVIDGFWDGKELDGGDIQELGEKYGLLKAEERTEPCVKFNDSEHVCICAEFGFPSVCYRKTY